MEKGNVIEWLTDSNTCFLLGAGCSKCAGKPLMGELTTEVVKKMTAEGKKIIEILNGPDGHGNPTIEDVTNQLIKLQQVAAQRKDPKIDGWELEKIEEEITLVQKNVVEVIGSEWTPSEQHQLFLQRLYQTSKDARDIFLLNYDTLIESSIEELKLPYVDGFSGTENAFFDPDVYAKNDKKRHFNVYKLHGSVNWIREENEIVRRRPLATIKGTDSRHVIYPAEQKYIQTQYGVYEILLRLFRDRLKKNLPNNRLVILGYSFSDEHINTAIIDAILTPGSNLTVFAFVGKSLPESRKTKLKEVAEKCDDRLNVFVGQEEYIGTAFSSGECSELMKETDLSRFENIVKILNQHDE